MIDVRRLQEAIVELRGTTPDDILLEAIDNQATLIQQLGEALQEVKDNLRCVEGTVETEGECLHCIACRTLETYETWLKEQPK